MFKSYKDAILRLKKQIKPIADYYNKPTASFWVDAFVSFVRYGTTPNQYIGFQFYRKNHLERSQYYTLRHAKKYEKLLNNYDYYDCFWNKALFNETFKNFIQRDWLLCESGKEESIKDFLNLHNKVIVKPTNQSSGKGIHIYNGEAIDVLISNNYMLEEYVVQHHEMLSLNPSSVNTVRVYTMIDAAGCPNVLTASLRVGGKGSQVDNYHSGGVGYPIDVKTGVIMAAGTDILGVKHLYHPGTEMKVIGFQIPNWDQLIQFVKEACLVLPSARLIAWDLAVLENGYELIEGNYDGDPGFMQAPSDNGQLKRIQQWF